LGWPLLRNTLATGYRKRKKLSTGDHPTEHSRYEYPLRQGGLWGSHDHSHEYDDGGKIHHHDHHDHSTDGHLWLDPQNAIVIVNGIAEALSIIDPQHEVRYFENAKEMIKRLEELDTELQALLAPVRDKPYVVYHDGTQYFDRHFKTKAIGALMGDSHYGFNAQHFLQISDYIQNNNVECVFTEPQFSTDKITTLMDNTNARIEALDYLGIGLKADREAYFLMMRNLAASFLKGLK
jgi:zinc transport system substrate-binding protein